MDRIKRLPKIDWFTLRRLLYWSYESATAYPGSWNPMCPSAGHCAVVAVLVRNIFGGDMVSTKIDGKSHWYNRLPDGMYIDLTGDQFGRPDIQAAKYAPLYPDTVFRKESDVNEETRLRAIQLSKNLRSAYLDDLNDRLLKKLPYVLFACLAVFLAWVVTR